jgi:hypothetical protein
MSEKIYNSHQSTPTYGGVQNTTRYTESYQLKMEHKQKMYVVYLELIATDAWEKLKPATQALFKQELGESE